MLTISIRSARTNKNLSQTKLGQKMGVSRQTVYRWEKGIKIMTQEEQKKFCSICNISQQEIKEFNQRKEE